MKSSWCQYDLVVRPGREARACLPLIQPQQVTVVTADRRIGRQGELILILDDLARLPTAGGQLAVLGHGVLLAPAVAIRSHGMEEDGVVLVERPQRLPTGQQLDLPARRPAPRPVPRSAGRSGCRRRSPPAHRAQARWWSSGSARRTRRAGSWSGVRRRAGQSNAVALPRATDPAKRGLPVRPAMPATVRPTAGAARDRSACAPGTAATCQKNAARVVLSAARISTTARAKSAWVRRGVGVIVSLSVLARLRAPSRNSTMPSTASPNATMPRLKVSVSSGPGMLGPVPQPASSNWKG